jgi:alpha-galactosidase
VNLDAPIVFPTRPDGEVGTCLILAPASPGVPMVRWLGASAGLGADAAGPRGVAMLAEHSTGLYTMPALRGHRVEVADSDVTAGRDWSTALHTTEVSVTDSALVVESEDAGLAVRTEVEALPGGALRARHSVTNTADGTYLLTGLEVTFPLPDNATELLDFTGRHERERAPQRHQITDGLWLRESRYGRPGLGASSTMIAGTTGFGFSAGEVIGVHVAWSGNSVMRLERDGAGPATIGGGELLLPGEIALERGQSYTSPWLVVAAANDGLDSLAAALHTFERSLPAHPKQQPVTLNVWEAVYFDHEPDRLGQLADLAARIGVERFVLDDGWFHGRRNDTAGLGDWWIDETVWPDGLRPLADRVHGLGMQFGLWLEPEMINQDSDLYRAHPDWILSAGSRVPLLHRHQLVLDLTNPAVWKYLVERIDAVLAEADVDAVKWDHNRDLLEAGSPTRGGAPAGHEQALAHYALLDELRARHPTIEWESCASGGGRIDLGVLERVQRVWTSDMTDALSRQQIQRWTGQFVAPEYLGAHVSSPTSHQTGRTMALDFRAATALFGAFGIEWDLTAAAEEDLTDLAGWVARYKRWRPLLHTGRMVRLESSDPAVLLHGVIGADGSAGLLAHVQLDESGHNRGVTMRLPGLLPAQRYALTWEGPVERHRLSGAPALDPAGPTGGAPVTGQALGTVGVWMPRRRPETITLIALDAID